jgi:hypothetical protein
MEKKTKKKTNLLLTTSTLKLLRLWCVVSDVPEGDTFLICVRNGLCDLARDRGETFFNAFCDRVRSAGAEVAEGGSVGGAEIMSGDLKRRVQYWLTNSTDAAIDAFRELSGCSRSAAADMACRRWILHLVAQESEEWGDTFLAAVALCRLPEDER